MKNKHKFNSVVHDKKAFDEFCHVASEFEESDILQIIFTTYLNTNQIESITESLKDVVVANTTVYRLPINSIEITVNHKNQGSIKGSFGDDAIDSLVLAHACTGINVTSPDYLEGIKTALDAIVNN